MQHCIFCQIARGDAPSWKVMENERACAFLDINPASRYHTLIIPKNHAENIYEIPEEDLREVITLVKKVADLYREKLGINNVQIISNSGRAAQQDVFHIHFHIVPRVMGDGQNIRWRVHPEWRSEFDEMLKRLEE